MLTDAQVERYSRQVLLPEVGGRGQARLLHARVAVDAASHAEHAAAELIRRAGASVVPTAALAEADAALALGPTASLRSSRGRPVVIARWGATRAHVALVGSAPCAACLAPAVLGPAGDHAAPAPGLEAAVGSLAAALVLTALVGGPAAPTLHVLDLGAGDLESRALAGPGCAACERPA